MGKKTLDRAQIEHLAKLSALDLADSEKDKIGGQLSDTLEYVKNLQELDTDGVEPTSHVADTKNVSFADGAKNDRGLTTDEALKNAKASKNGYFITKRILDKRAEE